MLSLHFSSYLSLDVSTAKIKILINIITALIGMDFIGEVSVALHIFSIVIGVIIATSTFIANHGLFELETLCQSSFRQFQKD